jgi:transposase
MNKNKPRTYTLEFKKESAALAATSKQAVNKTATELGVGSSTLHGWVKKYYSKKTCVNSKSSSDIELENKQLKKELLRVKQERDILKKAMAYFAEETL